MSDRIKELERENLGLQEMLFFVLKSVGTPVTVTKEALQTGSKDQMISIEDDIAAEQFVFSVTEVPNEV